MLEFMRNFIAGTATLLVSSIALAQPSEWPGAYGPHMWQNGWHGWFMGPVMMIIFLAIAVVVVVLAIRYFSHGHQIPGSHPSPRHALDVLRERYSKGEIDTDEFEERRRVLGES